MAMISEFLGQLTLNFGVGIAKIRNNNKCNNIHPYQVEIQTITLHLLPYFSRVSPPIPPWFLQLILIQTKMLPE